MCKSRARFRLLMPHRACGTFSNCSMVVALNQFSDRLQSSKLPVLDKKCGGGQILGELAAAKAGGDGRLHI